jgi:hypothetical protein
MRLVSGRSWDRIPVRASTGFCNGRLIRTWSHPQPWCAVLEALEVGILRRHLLIWNLGNHRIGIFMISISNSSDWRRATYYYLFPPFNDVKIFNCWVHFVIKSLYWLCFLLFYNVVAQKQFHWVISKFSKDYLWVLSPRWSEEKHCSFEIWTSKNRPAESSTSGKIYRK